MATGSLKHETTLDGSSLIVVRDQGECYFGNR
jgi:hypothetical protein